MMCFMCEGRRPISSYTDRIAIPIESREGEADSPNEKEGQNYIIKLNKLVDSMSTPIVDGVHFKKELLEQLQETQESMLDEILENYDDWRINCKEDDPHNESLKLFIKAELEKFTIIRK